MYPKFIEVHLAKDDCLVSLNIENIIAISDFDNGEGYIVKTSDRGDWIVKETYEDLKQMITEIGCLIRKQDPRLDTEHPLTMHDLQGMLGEPVWNSNTGKWTLVRNYIEAPEPDGVDVAFLLDAAENSIPVTAGDLQKKPLYRMKR